MKGPLSALQALSFFFLVFTTKPRVLGLETVAVIDVLGNEVLVGQDYFLRSPFIPGGGVTAVPGLNNTCPVDVAWRTGLFFRGIPIRFSPVNHTNAVVNTNTNLNIIFTEGPLFGCNQPAVWKVGDYQPWAGLWFITTGGVEGEYEPKTYPNWFYIERICNTCTYPLYKLVHCPSKDSVSLCSDVGISSDHGGRLALSKTYVSFGIFKASDNLKQSWE